MIINGIKFPDDLIKSIQNNELVVFAGAGVSMGKPTCLPSFAKLTRLIAKDTEHKLLRRKDYEVFLGELKNNGGIGDGPDVNKLAAEILSEKCSEHNRLHSAIIKLFENPEEIKIVTTNYDQMFEKAADYLGYPLRVYDAPALPLGNDVSGVVHLHGNVNNHRYIVLTDEDFGRAYLTDGYASSFLVQLYRKYDVLFIGYSLNDTVLQYLTKAMSRASSRNKYILTDKPADKKWKSYNITPIAFPEEDYDTMTKAVEQLGDKARMSTLQWKTAFVDIKDTPPKDLTKDSIVSFCLKDEDITKVMIQIISGESWVLALDEKAVFNNLFSKTEELSNMDNLWMGWLSKNLIGKEVFFEILATHKNIINKKFADNLVFNLIKNEKDISDDMLQKQVVFLSDGISEEFYLYELLEIADKRNLITLYWFLYKRMFNFSVLCEHRFSYSEHIAFTHSFNVDAHTLSRFWKKREKELVELFSISILRFCVNFVETLHNDYVMLGTADSQDEPWRVSRFSLEKKDVSYLFDGLYVLADIFLSASLRAEAIEPEALKGILIECLNSDSVFLRKLALISIRETAVYTTNQKYQAIVKSNVLTHRLEIQQTKRLVCSIFDKLSADKKMQLLDKIENVANGDDFEKARFAYSYLEALKRKCRPFPYIGKRIKQIDEKYDFSSIYSHSRPVVDNRLQLNSKDILELDEDKLKDLILFVCSKEKAFSYYDLMDELTKAASSKYAWTIKVIKLIINLRIKDEDLWNHMLYGVEKAHISIEEYYELLVLLANPVVYENNINTVSRLFIEFLRLDSIDEFFLSHEDNIFSLFSEMWKYKRIEEGKMNTLMQSLNTSLGRLVYSCIIMIYHNKESGIPDRYRAIINECLSMSGQEYYISLCVVAGHYGFFYGRDASWCKARFNPMLSGELTDEEYTCAWDGYMLYTGWMAPSLVEDISKVFLKATEKMNLLSDDAYDRFIDHYVNLLILHIKRPGANYIPRFFKHASDEGKRRFVSTIGHRLEKMESDKKVKLWKSWVRQHLINRTNNKPVKPVEIEMQAYLEWLPNLQEVYDEAVVIVCNGLLPKKIGLLFFDKLIKSELPKHKQESTYNLLMSLCENGAKPEWEFGLIDKVVEMMGELPRDKAQALENALIHNGWRKAE